MSPARCMGCHAPGPLASDWRIGWCAVELPGGRGLFLAVLCPTCWPRMANDEPFRERAQAAILTTAREQWEEGDAWPH